jgi:beta-glucanase (GH16 family)
MNGWPNAHCAKNTAPGQGFNMDFHTFGVDWTPTYIAFSIDGEEVCKIEPPKGGFWELGEWHETDMESPWSGGRNPLMSPFDEQFFLVMNVAVGGTGYFPDDAVYSGGKPWSNESPTVSLCSALSVLTSI